MIYKFNRLVLFLIVGITQVSASHAQQKPNIIFIAIDDLRPDLGCNGNKIVKSPYLDELAKEGIVFNRHYAVVPTCGASRYALLTGKIPHHKACVTNRAMIELLAQPTEPEIPETFIHALRRHNYRTVGIGKISHTADGLVYGYEEQPTDQLELPYSWDEMLFDPAKWGTGWNAFFGYADGSNRQGKKSQVYPYEMVEVADTAYPDGISTQLALEKVNELAEHDNPFFLALGLFKPHLPFTAPKKYWDLYNRDEIVLSPNPVLPKGVHEASLQKMGEFNRYQLGEEKAVLEKSLTEDYARKLIHAYYASISFSDAQVGKIIARLKELNLYDDSMIIIWGDHGWHLGDHRIWGKHTLFERALRSALIVKPPKYRGDVHVDDHVVSSLDIYPTIMDLCDLPMPYDTEGRSMQQLWESSDPNWENHALGFFRNGLTLRTDQYRITKYYREEKPDLELFDHTIDPYETTNIAAKNPLVAQELLAKLEMYRPAFLTH